jgi:hypothetical protein
VLQDLREAEQCRQTLALRFTRFHQFWRGPRALQGRPDPGKR